MPRTHRVSLGEIAAATGFSKTTVSLSLRNHRKIAALTRKRIREAAEQMGYRPNPLVSANMAQIRQRNEGGIEGTLGVLTWGGLDRADARQFHLPGIFAGIRKRADEKGFRVDQLDLSAEGMTAQRLDQICAARAIFGLILLFAEDRPAVRVHLPRNGDAFAMVNAGVSLVEPRAPQVAFDLFGAVTEGYRTLRAAGYRRIGMLLDPATTNRFQGLPAAAFLQAQMEAGESAPRMACTLPEQILDWNPWGEDTDALLLCHPGLRDQGVIQKRFPAESCLDLMRPAKTESKYRWDGYAFPGEEIGHTAVEVVTHALYHNQFGFPTHPHRIHIPPTSIERRTRDRPAAQLATA